MEVGQDMTTGGSGGADDASSAPGSGRRVVGAHKDPSAGWAADILGPGFEQMTLPLLPDEEDDGAVATLVRHLPADDPAALAGTPTAPRAVVLHLHGWRDYFFQPDLARELARIGLAFYALDLRRYGRSLREGQMEGWVTSLTTYDEEIGLALARIRSEQPGLGVVLMGHSTGGLTAALWADRHPGALSALVLNSPWLEIQGSTTSRLLGSPILRTLARRDPRRPLPLPTIPAERVFDVALGWTEADGALPDPAWADDPYVTGWPVNAQWRPPTGTPIRPGWLLAVMAGQGEVARGLDIRCPVLVMASARTHLSPVRVHDSRSADTIIDADASARLAVRLGSLVTIARFDGAVHDVGLSAPPVRAQVHSALRRWLAAYALH